MQNLTSDVIDSREIIERRDDLESELTGGGTFDIDEFLERYNTNRDEMEPEEIEELSEWMNELTGPFDIENYRDDVKELTALNEFIDECSGYGDFDHGDTVIADGYFETYAQEFANDIGAIDESKANWPTNHIDWKAAADELKQDYMSVDFDGETYWIRA